MKLAVILLAFAILKIEFACCYSKSYEYFKVYAISYETQSDVENIKFWEHNPLIDFWSLPGVNKTNNILVDPSLQSDFEEFLSLENFNYRILIENVGKLVRPSIFVFSFRSSVSINILNIFLSSSL